MDPIIYPSQTRDLKFIGNCTIQIIIFQVVSNEPFWIFSSPIFRKKWWAQNRKTWETNTIIPSPSFNLQESVTQGSEMRFLQITYFQYGFSSKEKNFFSKIQENLAWNDFLQLFHSKMKNFQPKISQGIKAFLRYFEQVWEIRGYFSLMKVAIWFRTWEKLEKNYTTHFLIETYNKFLLEFN